MVESLVPLTRIAVINKTINIAGKLIQIGIPNKVGTKVSGFAATILEAVKGSFTSQTGGLANHAGKNFSNPLINCTKWFDQAHATAINPIAYSNIKTQPTIQAANSPRVANV